MSSLQVSPSQARALDFLLQARKFGLKLGLATMEHLVRLLGHPEKYLRFIHIAGTNGKGSTAAFCASVLQAASRKAGLFTSPHLCSIRERIQINGQKISREDFQLGLEHIQRLAEANGLQPTFFEILTAVALWYFQREGVEWVVWETGLGGRLDSTNVVIPKISIITGIALDHADVLGSTLEAIAMEKAGIIKPGIPVVAAIRDAGALAVVRQEAERKHSPFCDVYRELPPEIRSIEPETTRVDLEGHSFDLGLTGSHQATNAACAYAAFQIFKLTGDPLPLSALAEGLRRVRWPGRFQIVRSEPPLVIDGAHNLEAVEALIRGWSEVYDRPYHLVFGALRDKPYAEMASILSRRAVSVSVVGIPSDRSVEPSLLSACFSGMPVHTSADLNKIWDDLVARPEPILIAGSLFLAGHALTLARAEQFPAEDFMLNEKLR